MTDASELLQHLISVWFVPDNEEEEKELKSAQAAARASDATGALLFFIWLQVNDADGEHRSRGSRDLVRRLNLEEYLISVRDALFESVLVHSAAASEEKPEGNFRGVLEEYVDDLRGFSGILSWSDNSSSEYLLLWGALAWSLYLLGHKNDADGPTDGGSLFEEIVDLASSFKAQGAGFTFPVSEKREAEFETFKRKEHTAAWRRLLVAMQECVR